MNTMLSVIILLAIVITATGIALTIGRPVVDMAVRTSDIKSAEDDLHYIDSYIRTVASEGKDSVRIFRFNSPKDFESLPGDNAIQFSTQTSTQLFDYMSRSFSGNFVYVAGDDVSCRESGSTLVAENTRLKAVFTKISGNIDTGVLLTQLVDKTNNVTVFVGNSSIMIDSDPSTTTGTGYSELGRSGTNLPVCQIHAFVNSTIDYDIYYKLYAGADFLVVEVRNIH